MEHEKRGGPAPARPGSERPFQRAPLRPVQAPPVKKSAFGSIFVLLLLAVGGYGAVYGYGRYKVGDAVHAFDQEAAGDFHNWLMRRGKPIAAEDIRAFVAELAPKHGLRAEAAAVQPTIEPYTAESAQKLPQVMRAGIGMAQQITSKREGPSLWVVGFRAELEGKVLLTNLRTASEHYTWFQQVKQ